MPGIGKFQFIKGVGIINGTFDFYFDKTWPLTRDEDIHPISLNVKAINGMQLTAFKKLYDKKLYNKKLPVKTHFEM